MRYNLCANHQTEGIELGRITTVSKSDESYAGSHTSIGSELLVRFHIYFRKMMFIIVYTMTNWYYFFVRSKRFLIVPPQEKTARIIVLNLRAFLYSTQGLFVAILYCFMNGEVKNSIKNHLERWRSLRSLYSQKHSRPAGNKGSASSGSTLLNPTIGENDNTLDDIRTSLLKRGQQLKDFNNVAEHNLRPKLLQVNLFNPE